MLELSRNVIIVLLDHRSEHWADETKCVASFQAETEEVNQTGNRAKTDLEKRAITDDAKCTGNFALSRVQIIVFDSLTIRNILIYENHGKAVVECTSDQRCVSNAGLQTAVSNLPAVIELR